MYFHDNGQEMAIDSSEDGALLSDEKVCDDPVKQLHSRCMKCSPCDDSMPPKGIRVFVSAFS